MGFESALGPAGAIASGVGVLGGIASGLINNAEVKEMMKNMPKYKGSGLETTLLNARMPGAAQAERNIFQSGANTLGRMQQAATSSADLMQGAAGVQSQENQGIQGLAVAEGQDFQRRYQNYKAEKLREYEDEQNRFAMEAQMKGLMAQNRTTMLGTNPMNLGMAAMYAGVQGKK
jgi:hypothetical protein